MRTVGYSGKSLAEKLGIKPGSRLHGVNAPNHYGALIGPLPPGALVSSRAEGADLARQCESLAKRPRTGAALWISWPKKTSKLFIDLTEDGVRELVLPTGWVDVKVCAVDGDWSALKFLRRRSAPRDLTRSKAASPLSPSRPGSPPI